MNDYNKKLDEIEFKEEIAQNLKLDTERDIFDLKEETSNIINEKRKILEFDSNKNIELNELDTTGIENVNTIDCYYISIRDKEDCDKYTYMLYDTYKAAYEQYNKLLSVKTLDDWKNSSYYSFYNFVKLGDKVDQDIIDYFTNGLPPITYNKTLVQNGEPYDERKDPLDNKFKSTYITFEKVNGDWIYRGNCFKGKNYDTSQFVLLDNLENYKDYKILLQEQCKVIALLRKDEWEINLEVNGYVEIEDKSGKEVPLYDEELKKSIEDNTIADKYNIISNNWLELFIYKLNNEGVYEYYDSTYDSYAIEEIGSNENEVKNSLEEILDCYIETEEMKNKDEEEQEIE